MTDNTPRLTETEAAHTDITTYLKIVADMTQEAEAAEAELATLRAQVERLTEALTWYGEQARLSRLIHSEGDIGRQSLADDGGKRARAALTEGPAP